MAFIEYNPNPRGINTGDCVIRAICKALGMEWEIEVPDNLGRKKVAEVRKIFKEQYGGEIIRIVKDC